MEPEDEAVEEIDLDDLNSFLSSLATASKESTLEEQVARVKRLVETADKMNPENDDTLKALLEPVEFASLLTATITAPDFSDMDKLKYLITFIIAGFREYKIAIN